VLHRNGCKIVLATVLTGSEDEKALENLRPYLEEVIIEKLPKEKSLINCVLGLIGDKPLQALYSFSIRLAKKIETRMRQADGGKEIDLIHFEHLRGGKYGEYLIEKMSNREIPRKPVVWDSVDSISALFQQAANQSHSFSTRVITGFELNRTRSYEKVLTSFTDRVLVTSNRDHQAFDNFGEKAANKLRVVSNGVDLDYFLPGESDSRKPDTILISGKMSYHANIRMVHYFVEEIFPIILKSVPHAKLWVVGKDPHVSIRKLARESCITITGQVPDMRPFLQQAAVSVAPMVYGAGIQNKVLEAMASSTPVVTTPVADISINGKNGVDYLVEETPDKFAGAVINLLKDEQFRVQIGESGRRFVETHHDWSIIGNKLIAIYQELINLS
jgi:glycosyltransferase involved in cell wall biosynthesis